MKKILFLMVLCLMVIPAVVAEGQFEDGVYFAQEQEFPKSGWKYNVTLVVEGGKIEEVLWNGSNINAGTDKKTRSLDGQYPMVANGGAIAEWHVQAEKVEDFLVKTQDVEKITLTDADGHTDAVSGATIKVGNFVTLVNEALAAGPVGYGPYKDGVYSAEEAGFSEYSGYKYMVEVTVTSGYIVSVAWDGVHQDGGKTKNQRSLDGEYGMVENGGAMAPWHEQATEVEAYVLAGQTVDQPDAITGASIGLDPFFTLLNEALSGADR